MSQARNQRALFAACFTLVSCLAYTSTLKMEETCSSETSVDFQQTTLSNIPEDRTPLAEEILIELKPALNSCPVICHFGLVWFIFRTILLKEIIEFCLYFYSTIND
jgi:hypothetical protein